MDEVPLDELTREALEAEPIDEIPPSAVPFDELTGTRRADAGLLPEWYMPPPQRLDRRPRKMFAVTGIIAALIVVNGAGLCVTYGFPEIAW